MPVDVLQKCFSCDGLLNTFSNQWRELIVSYKIFQFPTRKSIQSNSFGQSITKSIAEKSIMKMDNTFDFNQVIISNDQYQLMINLSQIYTIYSNIIQSFQYYQIQYFNLVPFFLYISYKLLDMIVSKMARLTCISKNIRYSYIKKKSLDDIQAEYGKTNWERFKMFTKQAKYIFKEGMIAMKTDLADFTRIMSVNKEGKQHTSEQLNLKKRIYMQFHRMKTLVLISILPFSGPITLYYLYTYPLSVPTWFCIDQIHEKYQLKTIERQKLAIQHYSKTPLDLQKVVLKQMSIQELKILSQLLFGHYEDGVFGINNLIKSSNKQYLIHPTVTKYLLIRNIRNQFKIQKQNHQNLELMSLEQLVVWKYNLVMRGENTIKFVPIQHPNQQITNPKAPEIQQPTPKKQQPQSQDLNKGTKK